MSYTEKLAIANAYLQKKAGVSWDDLPDINSLYDCEEEEDIFAACDARLAEDDFPFDEDEDIEEVENDDEFINFAD
jgi:hypothetical protein